MKLVFLLLKVQKVVYPYVQINVWMSKNWSVLVKKSVKNIVYYFRSVCENLADAWWKKGGKEKDCDQREKFEPCF